MLASTKSKAKILPRANSIIVVGYALTAAGLVGVLTINGASEVPPLVQAGVAALIIIGLLLSITGILKLRSEFDKTQVQVRNGLFMHGLALVILLLGVGLHVNFHFSFKFPGRYSVPCRFMYISACGNTYSSQEVHQQRHTRT